MMLRVPRFDKEPVVDGRLDEDVWTTAACADSFFQHSMEHYAAVPSRVPTRVCLGYTSQDLYVGFVGGDAHPDSLVVKARYHDEDVWYEDALELFLDPGFDHQDYLHIGVTSQGVVADGAMGMGGLAWNAEATAAAHVGPDRWSLEYRVAFDEPEIPPPMPGAWWGADFVRVYRGSEYSQWVRTYHGGHRPDEFGLLVFE
jgi:hypothetical protein